MGTSLAAVLLLSSSVSTVTLATTAACEGNTTKSKLPSVPLMERSRQGTQSIIPDASHHYHYGDDMLPSIWLRPRMLEATIAVSEEDASSSIQEYSNRQSGSPSSLRRGSTTTTMARSGTCQMIKSLSREMTFKWPQSLSSQDRPSEQEGGALVYRTNGIRMKTAIVRGAG